MNINCINPIICLFKMEYYRSMCVVRTFRVRPTDRPYIKNFEFTSGRIESKVEIFSQLKYSKVRMARLKLPGWECGLRGGHIW